MDQNSILVIVGIVLVLGATAGCVFAIIKLRDILQKMDTTVSPKLDEVGKTLTAIKPAVAKSGAIMESVNVAFDAVDATILDIDETIAKVAGISGKVIHVVETVPVALDNANQSVKDKIFKRK